MTGRAAITSSQSISVVAAAFVAAIAVHSLDERPWLGFGPFLAVGAAGSVFSVACRIVRPRPMSVRNLAFAAASAALLAFGRYDLAVMAQGSAYASPGDEARLRGTLSREPQIGNKDTILAMDRVFIDDGFAPLFVGAVSVHSRLPLRFNLGDELAWTCRLLPAAPAPSKSASRCFIREPPRLVARGRLSPARAVSFFRIRLRAISGDLLPEPESSFLLGLLIGDRRGLPPELVRAFQRSGTSHILAVSGYNVAQLIGAVAALCACVAIRRKAAAIVAAFAVAAFVALVGGQASIVRAAIMGSLGLLAIGFRRRYRASIALVSAAAAMLAINPLILRHDIGFQLSFAAVWGLSAFGEKFAERCRFLPRTAGFRKIFAETAAATLATFPLAMHAFGSFAPVGLLANLFILPFIPWAIISGAVALALGAVSFLAGAPAAFCTAVILRYMESAARFFAEFPAISGASVGFGATLLLYAFIGIFWLALDKTGSNHRLGSDKQSLEYGNHPPP